MPEPVVLAKNLVKRFSVGSRMVTAVAGISLTVMPGEFCCILGPSGSGKSTLLGLLAGLERPTLGDVRLCGEPLSRLSEAELSALRLKNTGYIFQSYGLLPALTAIENTAFPLMLQGIPYLSRMKRARNALSAVGLRDRMFHRPGELSGGEQQRVGIARAFVTSPKVVFADEPTGNLDSVSAEAVFASMLRNARSAGAALIMVTHEESFARFAQQTIELKDGKIVRIDPFREVSS